MGYCSVCGKDHTQGVVCEQCGFDSSCDYEQYLTLDYNLPDGVKPVSSHRLEWKQKSKNQFSNYFSNKSYIELLNEYHFAYPKDNSQNNDSENNQKVQPPQVDIPSEQPKEKKKSSVLAWMLKIFLAMAVIGIAVSVWEYKHYINSFETAPDGNGGLIINVYTGNDNIVNIPSKIDGQPVTAIGNMAFSGSNITTVRVPDGVTSIGLDAFKECDSLESIDLPDSLNNIGNSAFYDCEKLYYVSLPNGIISIGGSVFYGCKNLVNCIMPNSLESIGMEAFWGCENLNIKLPNSLKEIKSRAFYGCNSLSIYSLPDSLESIGLEAFYGCKINGPLRLPNSLKCLDNDSFSGCGNLNIIVTKGSNAEQLAEIYGFDYSVEE